VCAGTPVGTDMARGVSGGQKKRVTTGLYDFSLFCLLRHFPLIFFQIVPLSSWVKENWLILERIKCLIILIIPFTLLLLIQ